MEIKGVSKSFGKVQAVRNVTMQVGNHSVFGLLGSNGAGKSTLLRMMAGILTPDCGQILVNGEPVFENRKVKEQIFYIPDDIYFFSYYTARDMARYYRNYYPSFDRSRFCSMMKEFGLDETRKPDTFSKGMRKLFMVIMGISAGTRYLLCDETFDGLDPLKRQAVKSLLAAEISNRDFSTVMASHNLRELEDICDYVGLLHEGGILLSQDLEDMKFHIHKVQCVLKDKKQEAQLVKNLHALQVKRQGSLLLITSRGTRKEISTVMQSAEPLFYEILPLSLEEIFISETEVAGHEIKKYSF